MPRISRVFIKMSLIWLLAALVAKSAMTLGSEQWAPVLLPTHLHMFVVGWVTHMIIGVALWLFPKHTKESPRGNESLSWLSLVGLSLGLLLRTLAEPGRIFAPNDLWDYALVASAVLQWIGGMAFVINIWPRTKGKK